MKLSHNVRCDIVRIAMSKTFDPRETAMKAEEKIAGDKLYELLVPKEHQAALKVLAKSDVLQWFTSLSSISVRWEGHNYVDIAMSMARPIPTRSWDSPFPRGEALKLVKDIVAKRDKFNADKKTATNDLMTLLKSVTTTDALFKVWPEGKKFYSTPPLTEQSKVALPAKRVDELNKLLGLVAA